MAVAAVIMGMVAAQAAGSSPAQANLNDFLPLSSAMSGHHLDVSGGSRSAHGTVIQWWANEGANQRWRAVRG
jgi:hypothetical protein